MVWVFWYILFGTLWASCIWRSIWFFRSQKFSAIIVSNKFFANLSSLSGTYLMHMSVCLLLSHKSLKLSLNLIFFPLCCSDWVSSSALCLCSLILSLLHLFCYWSTLLYFSIQLFYCWVLWLLFANFKIFPTFLLKFSLCSFIFPPNLVSIFITVNLKIFKKLIFNWKIVSLQYCVGFCFTAMWISN